MTDRTETARRRPRLAHVLVVHGATQPLGAICDALRRECVVRECTSAHEAFAELAAREYACVVCRVGRSVAASEFHRQVRASSWRDIPLVFVFGSDASTDDVDYFHREGANWVTEHTPANEVLALVRAVRA